MDGRTDKQTDRRTDGQTDGQTDGRIDRSKDGPNYEQTDNKRCVDASRKSLNYAGLTLFSGVDIIT